MNNQQKKVFLSWVYAILLAVAGATTGVAGIRTYEVTEGVPYALNMLYFERSSKKLVAIDTLTIIGNQREFKLSRNTFDSAGTTSNSNNEGDINSVDN